MLTLDKHYRTSIEAGVLSWHPNLYLVTDEGTSCIISGLDLKKSDAGHLERFRRAVTLCVHTLKHVINIIYLRSLSTFFFFT